MPNCPRKRANADAACSGNVVCDRGDLAQWETWTVERQSDGKVALRSDHNTYLTAKPEGTLECTAQWVGPWEKFSIEQPGGSRPASAASFSSSWAPASSSTPRSQQSKVMIDVMWEDATMPLRLRDVAVSSVDELEDLIRKKITQMKLASPSDVQADLEIGLFDPAEKGWVMFDDIGLLPAGVTSKLRVNRRGFKVASSALQSAVPKPSSTPASSEQGDSDSYDIMLSYRISDSGARELGGDDSVVLLRDALEAYGFTVFVGESALEGGQGWAETIQKAVKGCKAFIPVCSPDYGNTPWTKRELQMADNNRKYILPVWHSGDYPPSAIEIFLGGTQRIPGGNRCMKDSDFQKVVHDLIKVLCKKIQPSNRR
eukprot:TRINITY_DN1251_c0_g1_i2.p1 TRINITY_DN1251_c0_g1~~TRINITY_DN1251_c0_g1_i2.p1  ORF type:complete len:371 (-),score=36.43 TRINITY_DN1251_c0_g1_i2:158-1270(-)